jgi:hypothetical protein
MEWCFSTTKLLTEGWGWEGAVESSFERCFDPELLFFFCRWWVEGGRWLGGSNRKEPRDAALASGKCVELEWFAWG